MHLCNGFQQLLIFHHHPWGSQRIFRYIIESQFSNTDYIIYREAKWKFLFFCNSKIHLSEDTVSHLQRSAPSSPLSVRKVLGPASLLDVKIESALPGTVPTLLCICPALPLDGHRGRASFARPYVGSPAHLLPTHWVSPTRPNPSCSKSGLHLPRAQLNRYPIRLLGEIPWRSSG